MRHIRPECPKMTETGETAKMATLFLSLLPVLLF